MNPRSVPVLAIALVLTAGSTRADDQRPVFEPTWESLNQRETPAWFEDAKFGIFIHWGVYSVPAICHKSTYSEWYWQWLRSKSHDGFVSSFHERWYGKDFAYQDFAPQFRAELWQPDEWAHLFKRAGARYVVLVSKHHDGYALWPSQHASATRGYAWNSVEIGPKRDLCGDLTAAVREAGLRMGLYYSFLEWENPLYDTDKARYVEEHMIPQIKDLVARYQPAVLWPDGEWDLPDTVWKSRETLAWLYNHVENPEEFTVNDRWGRALRGQVGDYYTTEYGNVGGGSPGLKDEKPFEECRGIGHSFAFNRIENYDDYQTRESLVRMFIQLVSQGGNLLLNIGPDADGTIPVIMQDRLIAIGDWLAVNGDAIYGTRKGLFSHLPWGVSTTKGTTLFLHVFDWPADHILEVPGLRTAVKSARLLHDPTAGALPLESHETGTVHINLSGYHPFPHASVVALEFDSPPHVSNAIPPNADGSFSLPAEFAELTGGLQVETTTSEGGDRYNIGFWTSPEAVATWEVELRPRTTYRIAVTYANKPGTEGGRFRVGVGDATIDGRIPTHTGGWQSYADLDLGTVTTGTLKESQVTLQAESIPGEALTNLRRLHLTPVSE